MLGLEVGKLKANKINNVLRHFVVICSEYHLPNTMLCVVKVSAIAVSVAVPNTSLLVKKTRMLNFVLESFERIFFLQLSSD